MENPRTSNTFNRNTFRLSRGLATLLLSVSTAIPLNAQTSVAEAELYARHGDYDFQSKDTRRASPALREFQLRFGERLGLNIRKGNGPLAVQANFHPHAGLDQGEYFLLQRKIENQGKTLGADIIEIKNTPITHINGIQRILQGYLRTAFHYDPDRALYFAELILRYNRGLRTTNAYTHVRFGPLVNAAIQKPKVGIGAHYIAWSGKTQILVPLIFSPNGPRVAEQELHIDESRMRARLTVHPDTQQRLQVQTQTPAQVSPPLQARPQTRPGTGAQARTQAETRASSGGFFQTTRVHSKNGRGARSNRKRSRSKSVASDP